MLSKRIEKQVVSLELSQKLKDAGYVVFNDDDTKFAILAEKQRHICKNVNDFFKTTVKLTENIV